MWNFFNHLQKTLTVTNCQLKDIRHLIASAYCKTGTHRDSEIYALNLHATNVQASRTLA
uniref:Uncharacterized protein n=1 Tax=Candidatus Nitrotoga fabula TaxID=2182327 RepID=A0A2X0SMK6_9PROT|nr:protein of unknown function [Candidatus Nitrotoga fabula]